MLVFSRKQEQGVWIGGTLVKVTRIGKRRVVIAIDAPADVKIWRTELVDEPAPEPAETELAEVA